jgi:hypothetical protein
LDASRPDFTKAEMTKKREPGAPPEDVVLVGAPLPSGIGHHVIRKRGERLEAGSIKPLEEGKPIHGDLVRLKAREEPGLYDVQVEHAAVPATDVAAKGTEERSGPAQVASDDYRRGWNRLFGASKSKTSN